jgi:hypothetical protein
MAGVSPTSRSLKHLRDNGFIATKVEQVLHMPGRPFPMKRDAFGFGDLLIAGPPGYGAGLVQVTDSSSITHRIKKIQGIAKDLTDEKQVKEAIAANENAIKWLTSGNHIMVHGWAKRGPRGKRKRWTLDERHIVLANGQLKVLEA